MPYLQRVAVALALTGALAPLVEAQAPPSPSGVPAPRQIAPTQAPSFRRSVVHHYPYPYPNYYENDETAGFRNPGGVGRYREYYPPGNQFQLGRERDPTVVARFDRGGGAPDRAEQLQAEALGIAKYNSIQGHIDNYARPAFGFGYGVGGFGGFY
jgi:hypothetical protein